MDKMEVEEENPEYGFKVSVSKEIFIPLGNRGLRDDYEPAKKIGKGGFGKVYQVKSKTSNIIFNNGRMFWRRII